MPSDTNFTSFLLLIFVGFCIYFFIYSCNKSTQQDEPFEDISKPTPIKSDVMMPNTYQPEMPTVDYTQDNDSKINSVYNFLPNDNDNMQNGVLLETAFLPPINSSNTETVDFKQQNNQNFNASDFLPHEINDEWFNTDMNLSKYNLNDDKLVNTDRYMIGVNTIGNSLKNGTYDIRGTIPNPKFVTGPWNNSTYEPDFNLKSLY
jgi:hypothetical protein